MMTPEASAAEIELLNRLELQCALAEHVDPSWCNDDPRVQALELANALVKVACAAFVEAMKGGVDGSAKHRNYGIASDE